MFRCGLPAIFFILLCHPSTWLFVHGMLHQKCSTRGLETIHLATCLHYKELLFAWKLKVSLASIHSTPVHLAISFLSFWYRTLIYTNIFEFRQTLHLTTGIRRNATRRTGMTPSWLVSGCCKAYVKISFISTDIIQHSSYTSHDPMQHRHWLTTKLQTTNNCHKLSDTIVQQPSVSPWINYGPPSLNTEHVLRTSLS